MIIIQKKIILGLDGGGTFTRAMAADESGEVLSYAESGGSNPSHNSLAEDNVRSVINEVVQKAGCMPCNVACLVAGFAGMDSSEDRTWADKFTTIPGLSGQRLLVNDAVIAHAGALCSKPGIIVISGTGSIIFGVTESGKHIRNFDFNHYAPSAARLLSYSAVHRIIAGEYAEEDLPFVNEVLKFWEVKDINDLTELGSNGFISDREQCKRRFGEMAPLVTNAALNDVTLAQDICNTAVRQLAIGIKLLGACFKTHAVPVVLVGSVACSPYMKHSITNTFVEDSNKKYNIVEPVLSSTAGAVLLGLKRLGIDIDDRIVRNLGSHSKSKPG